MNAATGKVVNGVVVVEEPLEEGITVTVSWEESDTADIHPEDLVELDRRAAEIDRGEMRMHTSDEVLERLRKQRESHLSQN